MNLQYPESVVEEIQKYAELNTDRFVAVAQKLLDHQHRKTFQLNIQSGLHVLLELRADVSTLTGFLMQYLPTEDRPDFPNDEDMMTILSGLDNLSSFIDLAAIPEKKDAESLRKVFLVMSKDLRVVLIMLAFRFASLFDLNTYSQDTRKRIARETLEVYVPLAGRLGIYTLKRQLEDRCFSFLSEADFRAMQLAFERRPELKEKTIRALVERLEEYLSELGVKADISGRIKGYYSTYSKLKRKGGGSLEDIYDLIAVRVVVHDQMDCYRVLGLINNHWIALTGRFKDYIAMPKSNGYRSLHTTVLGMVPNSHHPVEVQIRTLEMHREAEFGIAAHWWYEEQGGVKSSHTLKGELYEKKLSWMQNLMELQESLRLDNKSQIIDLFADSVFVMTLSGRVIELPQGSTPLDFAYEISQSLGNHCFRVKINGEVVPLDYELKTGDRVFIVKKLEVVPNLYWLSLVKTPKAKRCIQDFLLDQGQDRLLDRGIQMMNKRLKQLKKKPLDQHYTVLAKYNGESKTVQERRAVLIALGQGEIEIDEVMRKLFPDIRAASDESVRFGKISDRADRIFVAGDTSLSTKIAACCSPTKKNRIVGYVTRGGFISVHKKDCKVLRSLDTTRYLDAWWSGQDAAVEQFTINVLVKKADLLTRLSESLQAQKVSLVSFHHEQHQQGYLLQFELRMKDPKKFDAILQSWKDTEGVVEVGIMNNS